MSLFKSINNIFSKSQSDQLVGISLQQESIALCLLPSIVATTSEENTAVSSGIFQHKKVNQLDFPHAIIDLQTELAFTGKCHIVLSLQQSQIVQVDKPDIPPAEINAALKWQIKDLVSISPDNMVLDYFDGPLLAGGKEKINVVCAPLDELKKIVAATNKESAEVASITTVEFAFANLLAPQSDACLLVCQQPNEEIVLLIVKQGKLYFHRRLRGFRQIANKTEEELSTTVIDNLALEVQRSSDFFERQLKQAPIKEIKVLLPMDKESFLARKLAENSYIPVTLLALPEAYQQHRSHAAAIGATMYEAKIAEQAQETMNVS
ncbi:MAG: MSHA biogenesis protein MshI [Colwellia sp.]|jgi:MSHA biogenesis protein MshI